MDRARGEGEKEVPKEEEGDTRGPPFSSLPPRLKFNGMPPPLLAERGKREECTELPPQKRSQDPPLWTARRKDAEGE